MNSIKLGIKGKFVSLAVALLFVVAGFIFIFFPQRQERQMSEYLNQKVFVISDMVSHSTTPGVLFDDFNSVNMYLNILKSLEEVQFALVYKMDGKKFAAYSESKSANYQDALAKLLANPDRSSVDLDGVTIAAVPMMSDGENVGRVIVGVTRENLKHDVRQSRIVAFVVGLFVLILGGVIFVWQTTRIVRPLLTLSQASMTVAQGNMDVEVRTETNDEVGVLAGTFNFMVSNIRSAIEQIQNKNTELTEKNHIIEEFNKHITDSIKYGKRIQGAILPDKSAMQEVLPQHFVLFEPKDVVSGDFYWFSQAGDKTIIAVVDCTGHGVPGAFMSMIGNTLLNQIVNEKRITGPALILQHLNIGVRLALKQEGDTMLSQDGMEVCLCAIEKDKVTFAGAGRPLYVARNGAVERIKGDSVGIGGRQKSVHQEYTNHIIDITPNTTIYMSSDGYADQNNPQLKKFSTRKFQELMEQACKMPIDEQYTLFLHRLRNHQSTEIQRDDITVIGIQLS